MPVVSNLSVVSALPASLALPVGLHLPAVSPSPSFYPPCPRKFERKRLSLTGGSSNSFQVVELFPGRKSYVNPLEPMEPRALEQKGTIS
ncbi:Uncharacterized protein APZ42_004998 [Daphnia magna]|uniref:Uncharacterized protein n=1 Tax=Daphnia magna TaxID=35525 RepID=A0A162EZI0_9CRUS|nr:Uncharacterized protein APZ42_004998 [Daphnia magna]